MSDRGIIFSAPMVRALLDGRKTQTRRLLSLRGYRGFSEFGQSDTPGYDWHFRRADACWCDVTSDRLAALLPYQSGDRLYVREAWRVDAHYDDLKPSALGGEEGVRYEADGAFGSWTFRPRNPGRARPSMFMPRWASRLWLEVTDVRVQQLQEISEEDAADEGIVVGIPLTGAVPNPARLFSGLWNSLHTKPGTRWEDNPWIYALTFDVRSGNIDAGAGK